jgi:homoserine kinase
MKGGALEEEDVIDKVVVSVPASTANLGPGFDVFGLALEMRSTYTAEVLPSSERWSVHFEGMGADVLNEKGFKFVGEVIDYFERAESLHLPPISINVVTGIPLTRGLGSSASAIVGLLSCFEVMMNTQFDVGKVLKYAIGIEGHPDNVTASLVGGFTIAASDKACLPDTYARQDAVFNIGRASMLSACIFSGNYDLLPFALHDRMHQHYREKLVTGFKEVSRAADRAGAYGAFLSGAGPSIAALVTPATAEKVAKSMQKAMVDLDPEANTYVLDIAAQGVILQPGEGERQ